MIEQIGSPADEAVLRLEGENVKLKEQLAAAAKETDQARAATKQAVVLLESTTKERDSLAAQVSICADVTPVCTAMHCNRCCEVAAAASKGQWS